MRPEFEVHKLNEYGLRSAEAIAQAFSDCLERVEALVPAGRERALVATKLQEACFFAKRGIASLPANQEGKP